MKTRKKLTLKRILKISIGIIIFFTLPTVLLYGFLYFKYNEALPVGTQGKEADALAVKMLNALDYDAYKATDYIEWTFKKRHHYKWNKTKNTCEVYWKNYKVLLDLNKQSESVAFQDDIKIESEKQQQTIQKAINYFNNDSFWLVAPYKVFDTGVERTLITLNDDEKALLITYTSGGSTPGDSYLWHLEETGRPTSFQMWVDILPINGLEATWSDWTTTSTGAILPTFHKLLFTGLEMEGIESAYLESSEPIK
ncbi:VWA domain-containing protein [Lacinutrix neustonica]|uniref:VWA domain-containing protein n=1 Tax=Lacinutrix neustonica TaxID=2980107 RepID=A0A9E8MVE1_9FLAO|nr:VWA domain-containing protein [Lacinutrix neustonica]WAC02198.1 VWA domain-containing protein [Lacinutrix neustonica]